MFQSRNRSLSEIVVAVTFVGFLTGFIAVLCIGNYYRAKKAMERQKQRRLAKLTGNAGNGVMGVDSPGSNQSTVSYYSDEQGHLLSTQKSAASRRRGAEESESLLLDIDAGPRLRQVPV
mmetsp:Transcript_38518/g.93187  ORF Transcript_38518/g.93187 Transcript_38518/m.93187 type:complete len:119 (-) Transcript_38518:412-768(-)